MSEKLPDFEPTKQQLLGIGTNKDMSSGALPYRLSQNTFETAPEMNNMQKITQNGKKKRVLFSLSGFAKPG